MFRFLPPPWLFLVLFYSPYGTACMNGEEGLTNSDEIFLRRGGYATDDDSLIRILSDRTERCSKANFDELIRQLDSNRFILRRQAVQKLSQLELPSLLYLRKAIRTYDDEVGKLAKEAMEEVYKRTRVCYPLVAIRLLAQRKVEKAIDPILDYLPFAGNPYVVEESYYALDSLLAQYPKSIPKLVKRLNDPEPDRRSLAGCILGRIGSPEVLQRVLPLLNDSDLTVRLRTAQGLLAGGHGEAIPTLCVLLEELKPINLVWEAEELLHYAAIGNSPKEVIGKGSNEERLRCRKAWEKWWEERKGKLDVEGMRKLGWVPRLVVGHGRTRIWVTGCDGKVRYQLYSSQPLLMDGNSDPRVLLTEEGNWLVQLQENSRVAIWDLDGKVVPQKSFDSETGNRFHYGPNGRICATNRSLRMADLRCEKPIAEAYRELNLQMGKVISLPIDLNRRPRFLSISQIVVTREGRLFSLILADQSSEDKTRKTWIQETDLRTNQDFPEVLSPSVPYYCSPNLIANPNGTISLIAEYEFSLSGMGKILRQREISEFLESPHYYRTGDLLFIPRWNDRQGSRICERNDRGIEIWQIETPNPLLGISPLSEIIRFGFSQ